MTRIFIEDYELDIDKELVTRLTYAISDIREIDSKSTAFSKTIILPGTTNNNRVLGNIFNLNNSNLTDDTAPNVLYNFNASKSAKVRIESDGLLIIKGVFRLMEIVYDGANVEYECAVFGELGGFASKMAALKLEDLDFSAYDHSFSAGNISGSWDTANAGSGYYYPLMDHGGYGLTSGNAAGGKINWLIGNFRPALYVKETIDKIFTMAGYTYTCDLFSTSRFKSLIMPYNRKYLTNRGNRVLGATITSTHYNANIFDWDAISSLIFVLDSLDQHIKYTAAGSLSGTLRVTVGGDFRHGDIQVIFYKNGVFLMDKNIVWDGYSTPQYFNYVQEITTSFNTNDYISCIVTLNNTTSGYDKNITTNTVEFLSDVSQDVLVEFLDDIVMNDTLPRNILQKDFFTSIMKLFNLYVYEDNFNEKLLIIKPYPDFYGVTSEDWSDMVDYTKTLQVKPMSEVNARDYLFKFRSDSDYYNELYRKRYNEGYGDRIFNSAFEFATESKSLELIFAATPLVGYGGEDKIYSTIFKQNNSIEEPVDSVLRILLAKKVTGVTTWAIRDVLNTFDILSGTNYGYAGHLDDPDAPSNDLNFGVPQELFFTLASGNLSVNQFNVYYSTYMAEITDKDSRLLVCDVKLSSTNIYNLDFSVFKYINGGLWRLIKVNDYAAGDNETTKCELLRVIYTTY